MSEQNKENFEEVISLVEEAQKRNKFNLADAIKGKSAPEKTVTIYTDAQAAIDLQDVNDSLVNFRYGLEDPSVYEGLEDKAEELSKQVQESRLTFRMRGISQERYESISEGLDASDSKKFAKEYVCALVASNIVSVENAAGEIDEREFNIADGLALYDSLPKESWITLVHTMEQLTLATGVFKGITDASFLQKS